MDARDGNRRAEKLCAECPVKDACLADASEYDETFALRGGVWMDTPNRVKQQKWRPASRHRQSAYRDRKKQEGIEHPERIPHGSTTGYTTWGCRCLSCLAANRAYRRVWEERQRVSA